MWPNSSHPHPTPPHHPSTKIAARRRTLHKDWSIAASTRPLPLHPSQRLHNKQPTPSQRVQLEQTAAPSQLQLHKDRKRSQRADERTTPSQRIQRASERVQRAAEALTKIAASRRPDDEPPPENYVAARSKSLPLEAGGVVHRRSPSRPSSLLC